VLGVMVANARGFARATRGIDNPPAKHWNNRYAAAAAATLALIGLAILLMYSSQHLILVIELIVIIGFVVFWFMQTRELWDYPTREQKSQEVDQVMAEAGGEQEPELEVAEEPTSTSQPEVPALTETPMSRGEVYKAM
jgi:hypothetical protein